MQIQVRLERVRSLSSSTKDFRFVRVDGEPVSFVPGQFFRFVFTDQAGEFERSYSLCNFESDCLHGEFLDLVISTVDGGRASKLLFDAGPGFEATVTGPFGRLVLPEKLPKRLFLVATSVGIAPYMPMLDALRDSLRQGDVDVYFFYGTRDAEEFIYGQFLSAFAEQYKNFHLTVCYSRIESGDASIISHTNVTVRFGYVQNNMTELKMSPATDHVLLCGNPMMIDDLYPQLKQQGFGVRQVVREKYVFAKRPGVKNPAVEMTAEQKRLLAEKMKKYS